jgi:alpha-glucosidase
MDIQKILYVLRALGLPGIIRTIQYGLIRDRIENRYSKRILATKSQAPGETKNVLPIPGGMRVGFTQTSVEIIFLSNKLIRISWGQGNPPIPYTIAKSDWETQQPVISSDGSGQSLSCRDIELSLSNTGGITFRDREQNILKMDHPPLKEGDGWNVSTALAPEEHIYGLGERASSLNLRPGNYCSWNTDIGGSYSHGDDTLYEGTPIYLSLSNVGSYLVYFENSYRSTFQIGNNFNASFAGGMLRYYIFFGSLETIFTQLAELIGHPCMPPRWVLGYHQSRWGYKSEADIRRVVNGFKEHDLPLSAIHLDIDYMDRFRLFSINRSRFPAMKNLTSDLEGRGIKVVAILNPAVKQDLDYKIYSDGITKDVFCKLPTGKIVHGVSWSGWSVFPDFSKPDAREWWQAQYPLLLEEGIAGIWHDMNEPASFAAWGDKTLPKTTFHFMDGQGGDHREGHNLYGWLMSRAGYEAILNYAPHKRPWIFSRAGWAGLQRYAWNWTGDVETSWAGLRQTIPTILGLGLSGHAFSGVDIGGFSGSPDAELYLRWFQMATFLPLFRTHSAIGTKPREPWVYGEPTTSIIRKFLKLRYKLLPYLYTLAWETTQTGVPPVRPIFWENPKDRGLWDIEDEFLLGNTLLIAPILHEKQQIRRIILPPGIWYSFWDDQQFVGPIQVDLPVAMDKIPIFVKGGTLLPTEEDGTISYHIYQANGKTIDSHIYFDDGDGYGPWRVDTYQITSNQNSMDIIWVEEGEFQFPYPTVFVQFHGNKLIKAVIDGEPWKIQGDKFETPKFKNLTVYFE